MEPRSLEPERTDPEWISYVRHPRLAIVIDGAALTSGRPWTADRSLYLLVEALELARVRIHVLEEHERFGAALAWLREHAPDARIISLGHHDPAMLGPDDRAIGIGRQAPKLHAMMPSAAAARAFLWWVVERRLRRNAT